MYEVIGERGKARGKHTYYKTYLYIYSINFFSLFGCFGNEDVQKGFRAVVSV